MKKSMVFVLGVVLILSLSFISAGFFSDFFGKITGKATGILSCDDTGDGGINYGLKGTTFDASGFEATDVCIGSDYLVEYYCSGSNHVYGEIKDCGSNLCSEGACVGEIPDTTDPVINVLVQLKGKLMRFQI